MFQTVFQNLEQFISWYNVWYDRILLWCWGPWPRPRMFKGFTDITQCTICAYGDFPMKVWPMRSHVTRTFQRKRRHGV